MAKIRFGACALILVLLTAVGGLNVTAQSGPPLKTFTVSERANPRLAQRLNIPLFFALPDSARGKIKEPIPTNDILVDFRHPEAKELGLRIVETRRAGMSERLAASGLFETGDFLLTFRPEWGGAGAYPNVQMGVSHVGVAYIKDGRLHNIDNPLTAEYNSPSDLRSANYKAVSYMHVVRPRDLKDAQRANLLAWITLLSERSGDIYPRQLAFNSDYNAPKYRPGQPPEFVRQLAQMALGQYSGPPVALYCSEFAWALLSLRNCDPARMAGALSGSGMPACVREPMRPMHATGDYVASRRINAYPGLADGPLIVIDALGREEAERRQLLLSVFSVTRPDSLRKMSSGHQEVAKLMQPKFEPLAAYYVGVVGSRSEQRKAAQISAAFAKEIPQNYSPTSFLINTLLPPASRNRTMDYIATIVVR